MFGKFRKYRPGSIYGVEIFTAVLFATECIIKNIFLDTYNIFKFFDNFYKNQTALTVISVAVTLLTVGLLCLCNCVGKKIFTATEKLFEKKIREKPVLGEIPDENIIKNQVSEKAERTESLIFLGLLVLFGVLCTQFE